MYGIEKEMIEDYGVESSVWIGGKRIVLGINEENTEKPRYMSCIVTDNGLFGRYEGITIGTRFKALAYERAKQRNRLRRMHDSTAMQPTKEIIYDLSAQMAELRRQMKLCEGIAERCGVIEMVVNEIERGQIAEKKKPAEKKKCEKGIDI